MAAGGGILRELFMRLGLDVDAQAFAKGNLAAEGIKLGLEKAVDAARELTATFVENIGKVSEYGENILRLSEQTGLGTAAIQGLGKAAQSEGIGVDELGRSLILLSRSANEAKRGSAEAVAAFRSVGVSVGQIRASSPGELFLKIADGMARLPPHAAKGAIAMELLGRSGAGLVDVLSKGRAGLQEFFQQPILSEEQLRAGKEVVVIQRALTEQTADLWRSAVGPLLPAIRDLLKQFYAWKAANADVIRQNLTGFLKLGVAAAKDLGKALSGLVITLRFLGDNWKEIVAIGVAGASVWSIANDSLVASFLATEVAAVKSGTAAALAWVKGAAPFLALGAIIGGLLLLFDDLRTYSESIARGGTGKNTIFGKFLADLRQWEAQFNKPGQEKPWWLKTLELARTELEGILEIMRILGWAQRPGHPNAPAGIIGGPSQEARDRNARYLAAQAPDRTPDWTDRYIRPMINWALGAPPPPSVQAPGRATAAGAPVHNWQIDVHPAAGMNEEQLAHKIVKVAREHFLEKDEVDAAAAAAAYP